MDLSHGRAVLEAVMTVIVHSTGRGRPPGWTPGAPCFDAQGVEIVLAGVVTRDPADLRRLTPDELADLQREVDEARPNLDEPASPRSGRTYVTGRGHGRGTP